MNGNKEIFASECYIKKSSSLSPLKGTDINFPASGSSDPSLVILSCDHAISAALTFFVNSIGFRPVVLDHLGASIGIVEILVRLRKAIVDGVIQCIGVIIDADAVEDVFDLHSELVLFRSELPYIAVIISSKWVSSQTNPNVHFYLWDTLICPPYNDSMLSGAFALALSRVLP